MSLIASNHYLKMFRPLVFSDHVAKLAHKVDWKKICQRTHNEIGQKPSAIEEQPEVNKSSVESKTAGTSQPPTGPWEKVAKYLQ